MRFINLHTHRKPLSEHEIVIRNAYTEPATKLKNLNYFLSCGIHPWLIQKNKFNNISHLQEALKLPNVIAMGECGLDRVKGAPFKLQLATLESQLEIVNEFNKPVIMHVVRAYSDLPALKKKYNFNGIIHGFNGNEYEMKMLIDLGFKLSFGYRLFLDLKLIKLFKEIPSENIYFETDTKPLTIEDLYRQACLIRNQNLYELKSRIFKNFERDFSVVLP
ncbi:MAG: TatD family hydrolase [Bacteroidia bacterium]